MKKDKRPVGNQTLYTPEIGEEICERLSQGQSLQPTICQEMGIKWRTVYEWKDKHPDFAANYARARRIGCHLIATRTRDTARGKGDSTGDVVRDKLIIDTDLRLLRSWLPDIYGDKAHLEHTGKDGGPIEHKDVSASDLAKKLSREELEQMAILAEKIQKNDT